jgi:hypothetical protein
MKLSSAALTLVALTACSSSGAPPTTPGASGGGAGSGGTAMAGAGSGGVPGGGSAGTSSGGLGAASGGGGVPGGGSGGALGGSSGSSASGGLGGFGGALSECPDPSIDRLKGWNATAEGTMIPQSGTLLVQGEDGHVAEVEWVNAEWHVVPVVIGPTFETSVDLSASQGLQLTYSATADFFVQMRSASHWSGGAQYLAPIPSTSGAVQTLIISFAEASWGTRQDLGVPSWTYAANLADVRGFVFVGNTPNVLTFSGLRIDGYDPPCQ